MPDRGGLDVTTLVMVPIYNESGNLARFVEEMLHSAPEMEELIIDDDSPDGTGQIADAIHGRLPQVSVLHRKGKLGLGTAYLRAFQYALEHGYDLVFAMEVDFSHNPKYVPEFLRAVDSPGAAELVIGSRYTAGGDTPQWSVLGRFISDGNIFARMMRGIPVYDCTSGYRCYRTSALAGLKLDQVRAQGYAFQVEMAYAMWRSGQRIREVPIVFVDRQVRLSKMSRANFLEAFRWVLTTRLHGLPVAQM
jgi:dolichol-phosphate mannosyltransferase